MLSSDLFYIIKLLDMEDNYFTQYKGLENRGANNCFVNVIIQSMFHLLSFRQGFAQREITHVHDTSRPETCLL
jgi:uncharacterized UBP type Zn finger protein